MKDIDTLLKEVKRIHFIGIGGSGMCPLAENTTDARIENPDIEVNDIETPETDGMPEEENVEAAELEKVKELLNQKEQEIEKEKKEYLFLMATTSANVPSVSAPTL